MASPDITVSIMAFEGGCLIDSLNSNQQGQALASKIEQADQAALEAEATEFDLTLTPIELGMAISALTKGSSDLNRSLGQKLEDALSAKLEELGISYGQQGGGLDAQSSEPGSTDGEPTDGSEQATDPSTDASSGPNL